MMRLSIRPDSSLDLKDRSNVYYIFRRRSFLVVLVCSVFAALVSATQFTILQGISPREMLYSSTEIIFDMPTKNQQIALPKREDDILLRCSKSNNSGNNANNSICCAPWDLDGDDWWLHHPDWEVILENNTHYCFSIIKDNKKATFMRYLHHLQWGAPPANTSSSVDMNCSDVEKSVEVNSGYGASTSWLQKAFWHAYKKSQKPFQIAQNSRRWLYSTANTSNWAYCESEDTRCYYLPVSPCPRYEADHYLHKELRPPRDNLSLQFEFYWIKQYIFRQRQFFRKQLYDFKEKYFKVSLPCTTMHVRRGDSGLPKSPFRRYAAVQEYIDAAHIQPGERIVLLTDDQSTIDEIKRHHPHYQWFFLDRPRVNNIEGGFDGHIPSGDQAFELLVIHAELSVASKCNKIVHGKSGFVQALINDMSLEGKNFTSYYVNTAVTKEEAKKFKNKHARVQSLFKDVESKHSVQDGVPRNTVFFDNAPGR